MDRGWKTWHSTETGSWSYRWYSWFIMFLSCFHSVQVRFYCFVELCWLCRLCRWEWERRNAIQGVTTQGRDDVPGHLGGDSHLCLDGGCSQMRSGYHPFMREQLPQACIISDGLLAKDIKCHSCQTAFSERSQQRLLVDQAASCAVHQVGTRLEQTQFTGAKEPACAALVIGECGMQRHEICPLQYLFFAVRRNIDLLPLFGSDKRITGYYMHPECLRYSGHLLANPSQTNDAEHLAVQFDTQQAALVPPACLDAAIGSRDVSRQCQQ